MASPEGPRSQGGLLALVSTFTATGIIATSIYVPSLPSIAADLSASPAAVKLTLSVFLAAFAAGQLVFGPVSDRIGRRPTLIAGMVICVLASIGCMLAPDIWSLTIARIVQGLGACAGVVVTRAVIRDTYGRSAAARAMSILAMVIIMAPILAPIIGGYIEDYGGWRYQFAFITAMALLSLALAWLRLPETHAGRAGGPGVMRSALSAYGRLGRNSGFLAYALFIGLAFAGVYCFVAAAPSLFIESQGMNARTFGWVMSGQAVGFFFGSLISTRLTLRTGLDRMVDLGVILAMAATATVLGLSLARIETVMAIAGPLFVWSLGMGLSFPNAMAGAVSVDPRIAGSASALSGFSQMGGGAIAALLIGLLSHQSSIPMTAGVAICTGLAAAAWFVLRPGSAEAATREAPTREAPTGEAVTGEAVTGEAATGEAATGEVATGEVAKS